MNRLETRGANVKWNKEENSKKTNTYVIPKAKASLVAREAKICFQTSRISQWLVLRGKKLEWDGGGGWDVFIQLSKKGRKMLHF